MTMKIKTRTKLITIFMSIFFGFLMFQWESCVVAFHCNILVGSKPLTSSCSRWNFSFFRRASWTLSCWWGRISGRARVWCGWEREGWKLRISLANVLNEWSKVKVTHPMNCLFEAMLWSAIHLKLSQSFGCCLEGGRERRREITFNILSGWLLDKKPNTHGRPKQHSHKPHVVHNGHPLTHSKSTFFECNRQTFNFKGRS